jgi:acetolactate synthase-1/2/3 large subunit
MKSNGAKLLVDCLIQHGVKYVFGIPGAKVDAVYEALREASDKIKLIVCRHEQNAAFMAAMFGRLTGQPGVVIVTSGPGVSNLATGLLTATSEGDPVIAIGANVPRNMRLKQTHQSLDNALAMQAVTKDSVEILVPESIPEIIETAFRVSTSGLGGAFFISIPQDVLLEETKLKANQPVPPIKLGASPVNLSKTAAELINTAKLPAILLGMQASQPQNTAAIRALLQKIPLPVVSTFQAAGVISKDLLDCFMGRVGLFKNQPGDQLLNKADVIITIGYDPIEYDPEIWNKYESTKKIIHIDNSPAEIHSTYLPAIELMGDIAANISELGKYLKNNDVLAKTTDCKQLQKTIIDKIQSGANYGGDLIHPLRFIHDLLALIDEKTTIISDIGSHYIWLARYLFSYQPHHLLFSNGQQTLGVALPWAIAARMLRPDNKIISVSGDGGFLFSAMELETAVREKCPFVHCVWRDGSYNMVLEQQKMKYQHESGVYFGKIDLVKFAESFGAKGYAVKNSEELRPILQEALAQKVPVLIDIPIDYSDNPALFAATHDDVGN